MAQTQPDGGTQSSKSDGRATEDIGPSVKLMMTMRKYWCNPVAIGKLSQLIAQGRVGGVSSFAWTAGID
jgi:hypothetical protein